MWSPKTKNVSPEELSLNFNITTKGDSVAELAFQKSRTGEAMVTEFMQPSTRKKRGTIILIARLRRFSDYSTHTVIHPIGSLVLPTEVSPQQQQPQPQLEKKIGNEQKER